MYEDFNEQDFALNAVILPIAQNDPNKQFGLNVAADVVKFILQTYISNKKISADYYLYGNINLRINSDGTWTGNITEEDFEGKWKENGTGISIRDKENIINFELYYAKDGATLLKDLAEPEDAIVLKRVSASE